MILACSVLAAAVWLAPGSAFGASAPAAPGPAPAKADAFDVLNHQTFWRFHVSWRKPATVAGGKVDLGGGYAVGTGTRWVRSDFGDPTPPPAADWFAPDFDDAAWPRRAGPLFGAYGCEASPDVSLLCLRGRFGVGDPARAGALRLALSYRGGAVVYLNGTEIARGHLAAGRVEPLALAEDYPRDAFLGPDGSPLPPLSQRTPAPPANLAAHYGKRLRSLSVDLPPHLLRPGANVLAIEIHRAAVPADVLGEGGKVPWGTCGLVSVALAAPRGSGVLANVEAPQGVQIWNCDALARAGTDVAYGDPFEPLRPVPLAAPQGGVASGQVVVSSPAELSGISAVLGDLRADGGATLPAGCVQVRYATVDPDFPMLLEKPAGPSRVQPIWLTARVPRDAAPGLYRGALAIRGLARPASVPVELTVYDWALPALADFGTSVSLLHCPESAAARYKAAPWSDRHFQLLEKSFALLGYAGNTLLSVSAIAQDLFGDHPVIVFRKEAGGYVPDLRFARRYLELYGKHAAPPRQLSVQVWNYAVSRRGVGRDGGSGKWMAETLKVWLLEGDRLVPAEMPVYTAPGTERTWAAVAAGMKEILRDLGWTRTRLLWGTGGDNLPTDEIVAFFKKIAPDVYWRVATHGSSVARWGRTPEERTQGNGLVVGYANLVRRNITRRELVDDCPFDVIKRDGVRPVPMDYLSLPPLGRIAAGYSGLGFLPFDYWTFATPEGTQRNPLASYVGFGNITPHCPRAFVMPGPDGPAATPQLEAFREGLQVTEAVLHLRAALEDPARRAAVRPEVAAEARATIQALMDVLESNRRVHPQGVADVRRHIVRIYALVSQVAKRPGAGAAAPFPGR